MGPEDQKPSQTLGGAGGNVNFGDMLRLMDKFHEADKELRNEIKDEHNDRKANQAKLFEKIEDLKEDIRRRDEERRNLFEDRAAQMDARLDALGERITVIETKLKALEGKDEFADVPWYFKPAWVKAFGLSIAAFITAIAGAFLMFWGKGTPDKPQPAPSSLTAPESPGMGTPGEE